MLGFIYSDINFFPYTTVVTKGHASVELALWNKYAAESFPSPYVCGIGEGEMEVKRKLPFPLVVHWERQLCWLTAGFCCGQEH